jgi:hypothetical protein
MQATLCIESSLEHDGDGLARFRISATNDEFSACVGTWAQPSEHLRLASTLQGFPAGADSSVSYKFGSTGICELEISCLDMLGHVGVWATFAGDWPVASSGRYQTASLFMRCDPASIDAFVSALRRFSPGSSNQASLSGLGP